MTIRGLIEAVGRGDSRSNLAMSAIAIGGGWKPPTISGIRADQWQNVLDAHDGSLDAAKALHDALVPGLNLASLWINGGDGLSGASVWHEKICDEIDMPVTFEGKAADPARAWLLAILRALEGGEG